MPYGDIAAVKKMLRATPGSNLGTDVDDRLTAIQLMVTDLLNNELYGVHGVSVPDTGQLLFAGDSPFLKLTIPARAITSVTVGGMIEGNTLTGGTLYDPDRYAYRPIDRFGRILGLELNSGNWGAIGPLGTPLTPVLVAGDFIDSDDDASVPNDLTYVANLLIFRFFQRERTSGDQTSGPGGLFEIIANPLEEPAVKAVINRYRTAVVPRF